MKRPIIFLTILFSGNLVGMYFEMYSVWWFDILLHFLGGFFMAMLMANYLADVLKTSVLDTKLKKYLIVVGAVTFIGVIWEFAEYLANQTLIEPIYKYFQIKTYFIGDLDDTMNDLLMDVIGAFIFLFSRSFGWFWISRRQD